MRKDLTGGFELDDDRARVDVAAVHRFLSEESYWAAGRPYEHVDRIVRESARVVGIYRGHDQIGFSRVLSDGIRIAYLADVYVLPEFRGRGLGTELIREGVENGPQAELRWLLHTKDAQGLYERFGFGPPSERLMERPPTGQRSSSVGQQD